MASETSKWLADALSSRHLAHAGMAGHRDYPHLGYDRHLAPSDQPPS